MSWIGLSFVKRAHGYTASEEPWRLEENRAAHGSTTDGKRFGWKLFHYLAGGGMRTFGRSVRQEEYDRRQTRRLVAVAVVAAVWFAFWLF